jgi:uncharacterized protein DUF4386
MNSLQRLGGACAIVLGVSYVLVGITYFLVPDAQRPGMGLENFYPSYAANPLFVRLLNLELAVGALFAIGAVLAIQDVVRPAAQGLARWTANLAIIGFAVTAINGFRALSLEPRIAEAYVAADSSAKAAIAATGATSIDPDGWLAFGAVGAWALATSFLILRTAAFPRVLAYVGVAVGILYGMVVVGNYFGIPQLIAVAAGLGGVVAAPIWFIGLGSSLLRGSAPATAGVPTARPVTAR